MPVGMNYAVAVAHGKMVSIRDIYSQQWVRHLKFKEAEITKLFEILHTEMFSSWGVLLTNGEVYFNFLNSEKDMFTSEDRKHLIEGEINQFIENPKSLSYCVYVVIKH